MLFGRRLRRGVQNLILPLVAVLCLIPVSPVSAQNHAKPYTVALSDSFAGSAWRSQMEREVQAEALTPQDRMFVKRLIINNSGNDVRGQAIEIRRLVAQGVDTILIDASSKTALNSAITIAHRHHIPVVSFDHVVASPYVVNVNYSNTAWGAAGAGFLARTLHGRGRVVLLESGRGTTGAERVRGAIQVFRRYPDIKIVARLNGQGNLEGGRRAIKMLLTQHTRFDAVWSAGGMSEGGVSVMLAAHLRLVPMSDAASFGWLQMLRRYRNRGLHGIGVGDAPWSGAAALNVALATLAGKLVSKRIRLPVQTYTSQHPALRSHPNLPREFNLDYTSPVLGPRGQLTVEDVLTGFCCHRPAGSQEPA